MTNPSLLDGRKNDPIRAVLKIITDFVSDLGNDDPGTLGSQGGLYRR